MQSLAHDDFVQQDFSPQHDFLAQQGLLQLLPQPPVAAQELRAMEDNATRDIIDRFWITFFMFIWFGYLVWLLGLVTRFWMNA